MSKVTAFCATADRRKFIPAMIASFLSQTFTDSDLLIIDDGKDPVEDLIPKNNPRIRYRYLMRPLGCFNSGALKVNALKGMTVGNYIIKFDDDDWSAPSRIEHSLRKIEESGCAVLGYTGILMYDGTTGKVYRSSPEFAGYGAGMIWSHDFVRKLELPVDRTDIRFPHEDTSICLAAQRVGQSTLVDAEKNVVARIHCDDQAGHPGQGSSWFLNDFLVLEASVDDIPPAFFAANKEFGL